MKGCSAELKGVLVIVVASLLWGTTGTAASYASHVSSFGIGAFSTGVGGVLLVLYARKALLNDYQILRSHFKLVVLGGVSVAIYPLAFYSSMAMSGVAIGTVVSIASAPLFAALLDRFISNKPLTLKWAMSFLLGTAGVVLMVLGKDLGKNLDIDLSHAVHSHEQQQNLGVLLGCVAGLTYALYSWAARDLIEKGAHSRSAMSGLFGFASLLLLPSLWFTGENVFASLPNASAALYLAVVPMFLGYLLFAFGLNFVDASKATLITLIEPIIATVLAVCFVGEQFKVIGWVGACFVMLCLGIQTLKEKR